MQRWNIFITMTEKLTVSTGIWAYKVTRGNSEVVSPMNTALDMLNNLKTTQIVASAAGFALGYFVFDLLISGDMTLHRIGAALIIGLVGAVAGLNAAEVIFERRSHRPL